MNFFVHSSQEREKVKECNEKSLLKVMVFQLSAEELWF